MKRVLFLMSDTGGGHRAAAEAIRDALYRKYGEDKVQAQLIDVFRASAFPMNYMPEFYPWIVNRSKRSWGWGYQLSNTRRRANFLSRTMYMANSRRFKRMFKQNPCDIVVSVHSIITRPTLSALMKLGDTRPPYLTVVTDLVTTHHFWYDNRTDFCFVPTQQAYERGIKYGMPAEKMRVTGLPVHPNFIDALQTKADARNELGWEQDTPTLLMVAGGDGMGTLYETARAIDALGQTCQLVIVAGRNKALKEKLENTQWQNKVHIYAFVTNMPTLMAGADMIVTKAGPATLTEAAIAGLPMIISDAIPGQEDGNVTFVVENDAGAYAPKPQLVAETVGQWLSEGMEALKQRSHNAQRIVYPNAVWEIADAVWEWANATPITIAKKRRLVPRIRIRRTKGRKS